MVRWSKVVFKHDDFNSNNTMTTDFMCQFQVAAKVTAAFVAVVGFVLLFNIAFGRLAKSV